MHPPMQAPCESYWCNSAHKARLCIWNQGSPVPPSAHSSSPPTLLRLSSTPQGLPEVYPTHGTPRMWVPSPPGSTLPRRSPHCLTPRWAGAPAGSQAEAGPEVKPQEGSPQERRVRCHGYCECQEITRERVGQDVRAEEGEAQEQGEGPRKAVQRPGPACRRAQLGLRPSGWADAGCLGKMGVHGFYFLNHLKG